MRAGLVLFIVVLAGCGKPVSGTGARNESKPAEKSARADWTHKELAEYLTQKGIPLTVKPAGIPYTSAGIPVAFLHESPDVAKPTILVYLCRDEKYARDQAGSMGEGAFSFGRFAIGLITMRRDGIDDAGLLTRVSKALKN